MLRDQLSKKRVEVLPDVRLSLLIPFLHRVGSLHPPGGKAWIDRLYFLHFVSKTLNMKKFHIWLLYTQASENKMKKFHVLKMGRKSLGNCS